MIDLTNLEAQLTNEEGRRNDAYLDSLGLPTIGIGHHDPSVHLGMTWTDQQIDDAFAADVAEKCHQAFAAFPWYDQMNEPRQAVLIEMIFQMGLGKVMEFHEALAAMRDEHWENAAAQMLDSLWAKETPARAQRMAQQMRTGDWQIQA